MQIKCPVCEYVIVDAYKVGVKKMENMINNKTGQHVMVFRCPHCNRKLSFLEPM